MDEKLEIKIEGWIEELKALREEKQEVPAAEIPDKLKAMIIMTDGWLKELQAWKNQSEES